jgi:hypothetical protein
VAGFTERLAIIVDANVGGFTRAMRGVDGDTRKLGRSVGGLKRGIGDFARVAAFGLAGVGTAAVVFGSKFVEAAEESVKVGKQTEAVIKSTGGAAKVTAGDVANLADKLSLKAGIDDELIQSGENVLLTFTRVRDEVGRGNDIFTQATGLALDMSVALGQDLQSSVVQVGKALNDPIRGVTALRRVGVQLTEQQEESIKTFIEQGDVLSAQKVILDELSREFEGSAAAQATASDRLKVAFGNVAEQIGLVLLPYVDAFATWMTEKGIPLIQNELIPALEDFVGWVGDELVPDLKELGGTLRDDVLPALQALTEALVALPSAVQVALAGLAVLARFGGFAALAGAATVMGKVIATAFGFVGFAATTAFSWILRIAPFGHLATLAFIFRDQVTAAFRWIADQGSRLFANLQNWGATAVRAIGGFFQRLPGQIAGIVGAIAGFFFRLPGRLASAARNAVEAFIRPFRQIPDRIGGILSNIPGAGVVGDILGHIPGFQTGGVIPGPLGAPRLIVAHGGEVVVPAHETVGPLGRMVAGPMVGGGMGGTTVNVAIDMRGSRVQNEQQFASDVVYAISRYARNNGGQIGQFRLQR